MKFIIINVIWLGIAAGAFFWGRAKGTQEAETLVDRQVIQNTGSSAVSSIGNGKEAKSGGTEAASLQEIVESASEVSSEEIGLAMADVLRIPNKVDRALKFAELLRQLTPENAEAAYQSLVQNIEGMERYQHLNLLFHAWGGIDPENAIRIAGETGGRGRGYAISSAVSGWAVKDINAAVAFVESQGDSEYQGYYQRALISSYAQQDPAAATDFVLDMESQDKSRYIGMIAMHQASDPAEAATWAMSIPEGEVRASAISSLARTQARNDPANAAEWLTSLPENKSASGYREVFRSWGREDPTAASKYLTEMQDSPSKDSAIRSFARTVADEDPQSATAWAATIQDAEERNSAMIEVGQEWYQEEPEAAMEWAQNEGLNESDLEQMQKRPDRRRGGPFGGRRGRGR